MAGVGALLRFAWARPASLQLELIWRLVGLAMLLLVWRLVGDDAWAVIWQIYPPEFHAMTASALALVVLGPRLVVLMLASVAWIVLLRTIGDHPHLRFIADEYLLFAALPGVAAVSAIFCRLEHDGTSPLAETGARAQLWHLRAWTLATLGFAALHKFNGDFLDPSVSCAGYVERELVSLWHVPPQILPSPALLLLLEATTPLLLLLYPRLGVAGVLVLAVGLGHTGPFAFNTLLLGLALAFLPETAMLRWRRISLIFGPAALLVGWASAQLYRGLHGWAPYLVFELVLVLVAAILVVSLEPAPLASRLRPARLARPWLPGGYAHRSLCGYSLALLLVNGMSPYLGLKFRYSLAMVSNLRADDSRWNSLIFPRWLRVRADPLIHVDGVYTLDGAPLEQPATRARLIRPGVYAPQELTRRLEDAQRRRVRATLTLRHLGVTHRFEDYAHGSELRRFLAALPARPLFQSELTLDRPQKCVH